MMSKRFQYSQKNSTLGELETKSLHLCHIKTCYTSLHSQNLLRTQIFIDCGLFLALQLILTIFFSVILLQFLRRRKTKQLEIKHKKNEFD